VVEQILYGTDIVKATLTGRQQALLKVLLVGDDAVYTSEQQFAPLLANRDGFREQLGVVFHYKLLSDALLLSRRVLQHYDVVGFKLGFRSSPAEVLSAARTIKSALAPGAKLVYFDGDDDLGVQWPNLLPLVDLYLKKHCYRDLSEYRKNRIGKSNLTDYCARKFGINFENDIIPTTAPVDEEQLSKIMLSWNIGLDDKIHQFYNTHRILPAASSKDIDVVCRATVSQESWIYPLRSLVIPEIKPLGRDYRVLTPDQRVAQDVYYQEMLRSRICVSPFGYGEICWRDFEAVLCGCVLVKPDMSHVDTQPNIFIPNETYVPVLWDYSDLRSTLTQLLAQPERCERLRTNAFGVLRDYFEGNGIIQSFQHILRSLGVASAGFQTAGK